MILICGASGLVGREFSHYLDQQNIPFVGTYYRNKIDRPNLFFLDFSNAADFATFLEEHSITSCVFCVVERLTDVCENKWNEIKQTNIDSVHLASYICQKNGVKFIHLSTDYVFDGSTQPNYPLSRKNPLQNYGISKLISEYRVFANDPNACIVRTPVLYSPLSKIHDNAIGLIGKNVMDRRIHIQRKEDHYCIRRPLYIRDLCAFLHHCIRHNYVGIYHFYHYPNHQFTKYEIAQIIGKILDYSIDHILPNTAKSEGLAPRPFDTQLADEQYAISTFSFTNFQDSIEECFAKYRHPKMILDNRSQLFLCLDLDGTLIETSRTHFNAYTNAFANRGDTFLTFEEWTHYTMFDHIDNFLLSRFAGDASVVAAIKREKQKLLQYETIGFTKNSELFLQRLIDQEWNFCIVTNTTRSTVDIFREKLPLLNRVNQWIYRDDSTFPKPHGEPYALAKHKYQRGEPYMIGVEDSMVGYRALKQHTDLIYIYNNDAVFQKNDCYLFDDYAYFSQ